MSNTINRLLDEAICEFANATDHLASTRNTMQMHAQREAEALNKVNEAQRKIDDLYEQMRSLAPKGSHWDTAKDANRKFREHVIGGLAGLRFLICGHKNYDEWMSWIGRARELAHQVAVEEALPQSAPSPDMHGGHPESSGM